MKSTSGNDGSYTLTVSFALGTNPDINTVNVNNRVQTALSQLPPEVQQQGLTVQKKSSAILQFIVLYSANGAAGPAVHHQLRHHQRARRDLAHPGRRPGQPVRETELLDADLVRYAAADQPQPRALRCHRCDPRPERAGAGRPHRRAADQRRAAVPVQRADARQADHSGAVRQHRAAGKPGRLGAADQRRRPRRDRRAESRQRVADRRPRRGPDRHLSFARRQCRDDGEGGAGDAAEAVGAVSGGPDLSGAIRFHHFRHRHHHRGAEDARRGRFLS